MTDGSLPLWKKAAWLLAGVLLALLAFEIFFRAAGPVVSLLHRSPGGPAERTILCEGDSFVFGTGGTPFPRQLEELLNEKAGSRKYRVVNMGTPGQNSALLAQILEAHLRALRPQVLIVLVGQNNYWNSNRLRAVQGPVPWKLRLRGLLARSRVYKFLRVLFIGVRDTRFHYAETSSPEVRTEDGRARAQAVDDLLQARALETKGEREKALALCKDYIRRNPRDAAGYGAAGSVLLARQKNREAAEFLEQGTKAERSPELEMVYHELGWARLNAGDGPGALRAWEEGLAAFPSSKALAEALAAHRGGARAAAAEKKPDEAELVSASFRRDIRSISSLARKHGAKLIFASYPEMAHPEVYETAAAEGDRFVDFRAVFKSRFKDRKEHVAVDDWHCNTAGYRVMAEAFAEEAR